MEFSFSPTLSNIFLQNFEKHILNTLDKNPKFCLHYVNDIFAIWQFGRSKLENNWSTLNNFISNSNLH